MDAKSVVSAVNDQEFEIPQALKPKARMLSALLVGKVPKTPTDLEKVWLADCKEVLAVSLDLLAAERQKSLLVSAMVIGKSTAGIVALNKKGGKRKIDQAVLDEEPLFNDGEVTKSSQVPAYWVWGVFKQASDHEIDNTIVKAWSKKSSTYLFQAKCLFTGIPENNPIYAELLEKALYREVMETFMAERGDLINADGGFFLTALQDGKPKFEGVFSAFEYLKDPNDENQAVGIKYRFDDKPEARFLRDDAESDDYFPTSKPIFDNYGFFSAYIKLFGEKKFLHGYYKDFDRSKYDAALREKIIKIIAAKRSKASANIVEIDDDLKQAVKRVRKPPVGVPKSAGQGGGA